MELAVDLSFQEYKASRVTCNCV